MYVIKCRDNGKCSGMYVAIAGSKNSYTTSLERARKFPTREAAQADCCGNEYPVSIAELMGR